MTDLSGNGHQEPVGLFGLVQRVALAPRIAVIPSPDQPGINEVLLSIETPIGSLAFRLTHEFAKAIGKALQQAARNAALGLTIVGNPTPRDNPDQPGGLIT